MINEIYIIDDDDSSIVVFQQLFRNDKEYKFINILLSNIFSPTILSVIKYSIKIIIKKD